MNDYEPFRLIVGTDSQPSLPIRFETVVVLALPGRITAFNRRLATMGPMALVERMLTETDLGARAGRGELPFLM
ncbi:MAG TPA: hypothetical protein VD902_02695 [Symbiobacteriaceae bacterium]|nr:hypothetical protein [Symbiobacteriaceae bacterium]